MSLIGNGSAGLWEMLRISREECGRLRAKLKDAEARAAKAERSLDFTHQWYAERVRRIRDTAEREGIWPEVACILANGTADPAGPPTYAQLLNLKEWRAKAAEGAYRDLLDACKAWRAAVAADQLATDFPSKADAALFAAIDKADGTKGDR